MIGDGSDPELFDSLPILLRNPGAALRRRQIFALQSLDRQARRYVNKSDIFARVRHRSILSRGAARGWRVRAMSVLSTLTFLSAHRFFIDPAIEILDRQRAESSTVEPAPGVHRFDSGLKKFLRDQGRDKRAQDDGTDQDGVLRLINDPVLQAEQ